VSAVRHARPMVSRRALLRAAGGATALAGATLLASCGGAAAVTAVSGSASATATTGVATTASANAATAASVVATAGVATAVSASAPAASSAAPNANGTNIDFWLFDQDTNTQKLYTDMVLPSLKTALPNVTVTMGWKDASAGGTGMAQSLSVAFAGGVAPDISQWGAQFAFTVAHLKMGLVIDQMLEQWGQRDDFFPSALQTCQWQGKTYGLPYLTSPRTYFARGDILKANGIEGAPVTWEDDINDGKKLTKIADGALTQLGTNTSADWSEFTELLLSVGGGLIVNGKTAVNSPEGQLVAQFMQDRYQQITPTGTKPLPAAPSGITNFSLGRQAISWGGANILSNVAQKAKDSLESVIVGQPIKAGGVTYKAPDPSKVRPVALTFTDWLIIGAQSKHPDDAFNVLKVVLDGKNLLDYNQNFFFIPPRKSVASQGYMATTGLQAVVKNLDSFGVAFPSLPESAQLSTPLTKALADIVDKKVSVQDGLNGVAQVYDPVLQSSGWSQS
jgi:ABC-type glycerol-3-phosphate transport system substrate-binding protein